MRYINKLSNASYQKTFLTGNQGQRITLTVRYMPSQRLWLMDVLYDSFSAYGLVLVNGVNLLRNYKNLIPFGLACGTPDLLDPYNIGDFASGYARLYLLTNDEKNQIELDFFT